jgi:uracil-DNA glycosylase
MSAAGNNIVDDVKRFLKFQSELSGGLLYLNSSPVPAAPSSSPTDTEQETETQPKNRGVNRFETTTILQQGRSSSASESLLRTPEPWMGADSLESLNEQICTCLKCPLGKTRTKFVFGVGNPRADIMLIGEAPGADEDRQGEPFVGRAGQLLNKILEAAGLSRAEVYICNILKCRPPGNRDPLPLEVEQCEPYLHKQIEIVKPKIILGLGRIAAQTLLRTGDPLGSLRGRVHDYLGIPMIIVYHPAALLRNANFKKQMWEDMKAFINYYNELVNNG